MFAAFWCQINTATSDAHMEILPKFTDMKYFPVSPNHIGINSIDISLEQSGIKLAN